VRRDIMKDSCEDCEFWSPLMVGGEKNGEGKEIDSSYCAKLERWVDLMGRPSGEVKRIC